MVSLMTLSRFHRKLSCITFFRAVISVHADFSFLFHMHWAQWLRFSHSRTPNRRLNYCWRRLIRSTLVETECDMLETVFVKLVRVWIHSSAKTSKTKLKKKFWEVTPTYLTIRAVIVSQYIWQQRFRREGNKHSHNRKRKHTQQRVDSSPAAPVTSHALNSK